MNFFIDKSMNFKLQSMDEINDFGPTTMLVKGKQYRKARIFLESPPRFYRQAKPWDGGIFYNIEGQDDNDKWQPYMKWNEKYTKIYKI